MRRYHRKYDVVADIEGGTKSILLKYDCRCFLERRRTITLCRFYIVVYYCEITHQNADEVSAYEKILHH
jgi:hypothetical protein